MSFLDDFNAGNTSDVKLKKHIWMGLLDLED